MPTMIEGMVQLNVPIPEELRDLIDSEIVRRCGYAKRGILGEIVTEALREFLYKRHTHTHTLHENQITQQRKKVEAQTNRLPNTSNTSTKYSILKSKIKGYGNENNYEIHYTILEDMIKQAFGVDKRTVTKYLNLLQDDVFVIPDEKTGKYSTPKPLIRNDIKNVLV